MLDICKTNHDSHKLMFSTNTLLGYLIAEKYYDHVHYAWFTTQFDMGISQPASSNPRAICNEILNAIASDDHQSEKLERICAGIQRGAYQKMKAGIISKQQELEIRSLVQRAKNELYLLMPVVYVSHWSMLIDYAEEAKKKASNASIEFICRELPRAAFDIIELQELLNDIECFKRRLL